jgi:hypothetical protein
MYRHVDTELEKRQGGRNEHHSVRNENSRMFVTILKDCEVTRLSIKTERTVLYPLRSSRKFFYELPGNVIPFFRSSSVEIPLDIHSEHSTLFITISRNIDSIKK